MGKIYTAPENYTYPWKEIGIFLAGGITGAPDWQRPTAERLAENTPDHMVILNPRRPYVMDFQDEATAYEQIAWEFDELNGASFKLFWFPKEAGCAITLFELGRELMRSKMEMDNSPYLFIGVEPGYSRQLDVHIQVELMYPNLRVYDDLDEMTGDLIGMINNV